MEYWEGFVYKGGGMAWQGGLQMKIVENKGAICFNKLTEKRPKKEKNHYNVN